MLPNQTPAFDALETVDEVWLAPPDALARAAELKLPPPQVRTLLDLAAARGWDDVLALSALRQANPVAILPRFCPLERGFALLLPWDPDYVARGTGEAIEIPPGHPIASGPSRFVLEEGAWRHTSPGAD